MKKEEWPWIKEMADWGERIKNDQEGPKNLSCKSLLEWQKAIRWSRRVFSELHGKRSTQKIIKISSTRGKDESKTAKKESKEITTQRKKNWKIVWKSWFWFRKTFLGDFCLKNFSKNMDFFPINFFGSFSSLIWTLHSSF